MMKWNEMEWSEVKWNNYEWNEKDFFGKYRASEVFDFRPVFFVWDCQLVTGFQIYTIFYLFFKEHWK